MTTAIGEELRTRYQPPDQLSPELRQVLRKVQCSDTPILMAGRVGRMRCGLLTTNRGVSLKFRSASSAAKGAALEFALAFGNERPATRPAVNLFKEHLIYEQSTARGLHKLPENRTRG